jgi:hypothetical protein
MSTGGHHNETFAFHVEAGCLFMLKIIGDHGQGALLR